MFKRTLQVSWSGQWIWRPLGCGLSLALGLVWAGLLLAVAGGRADAAPAARPAQPDIVVTTTIQAAIDAAPSNDRVIIPAGHYTESLTLNKKVSLIGASAGSTFVHALPGDRVLTVTGGAINNSTVISGLTFTGGDVTGDGGGISVEGFAQPHLENLIIIGNQASGVGGGLSTQASSPLRLDNVIFMSNTAHIYGGGANLLDSLTVQGGLFQENSCLDPSCRGGGLNMGGVGMLSLAGVQFISNTSLSNGGGAEAGLFIPMSAQDSLFQGNRCTAAGGCFGGAVHAADALVLTNTNFLNNTSTGVGGAVDADYAATVSGGRFQGNQCLRADCYGAGMVVSTLSLSGTQFISNTAFGVAGGGAFAGGPATLQGALFQGNTALASGYGGGGLFAANDLTTTDTQFIDNRSTLGGGGGLRTDITGSARLVNVLFAGNSAGLGGAALALNSPVAAVILHSTIVSPGVANGSAIAVLSGTVGVTDTLIASYTLGISATGGTAFQDYNLFSGVAAISSGPVTGGAHSHTGPAGFRNPAAGDYHLALGSAAINAGANAGVPADFEGDPRPIGPSPDIGYDEARLVALVLSKSDGQSTVQSGAQLTYTILVNNTGPYTATGVVVSDSLPASLINASWTCLASAGSSCPAGGNGSINALVTVAGGSFIQITLHATVNPASNGQVVNTVSASAPADLVNTTPAQSSASDSTTIIGGPGYKVYLPIVQR